MPSLVQLLYFLSTALLIPVIVLLLLFVLWTLLECGGFLRELRERYRGRAARRIWQQRNDSRETDIFDVDGLTGLPGLFVKQVRGHEPRASRLEKNLAEMEVTANRRLGRMRLLLRVGPMLGLMGTLIPLGPALIGLSDGNVKAMAEDLVVAFSTTVLGLFVGGLSYAMWLVRRQWYAEDLVDVEFVVRNVTGSNGRETDG